MQTKNGMEFSKETEQLYKKTAINMIYKLLPMREDGEDWLNYLQSELLELKGFEKIFIATDDIPATRIICKLAGLQTLTTEEDFYLYRKTVLECTNLIR